MKLDEISSNSKLSSMDDQEDEENNSPIPNVEKTAAWYNRNVEERYIFFATIILMGLNQENRRTDSSSRHKLILTPIFGELLPENTIVNSLDISSKTNRYGV